MDGRGGGGGRRGSLGYMLNMGILEYLQYMCVLMWIGWGGGGEEEGGGVIVGERGEDIGTASGE